MDVFGLKSSESRRSCSGRETVHYANPRKADRRRDGVQQCCWINTTAAVSSSLSKPQTKKPQKKFRNYGWLACPETPARYPLQHFRATASLPSLHRANSPLYPERYALKPRRKGGIVDSQIPIVDGMEDALRLDAPVLPRVSVILNALVEGVSGRNVVVSYVARWCINHQLWMYLSVAYH